MTFKLPYRRLSVALATLALAGCDTVLLNPAGDIAMQEGQLIINSTLLMLLIIVPVIALTLWFAWRYRASNRAAHYDPEWSHSTQLELVIWSAPLMIIIALGAMTWISTHTLDPYRPLDRIAPDRPVPADVKPLVVEVVALDWKWLFFYPEQGIATVNEMAAPVDRPIQFKITASSVMNSFYIPALAGQIYAMPGMETQLHAVINAPGNFEGFSANYSGAGFSHMRFRFHGLNDADFERWIARVKNSGQTLSRDAYLELEKPSEREPVRLFADVAPGLYQSILNLCVKPGTVCMSEMMMKKNVRPKAGEAHADESGHAGHGANPEHGGHEQHDEGSTESAPGDASPSDASPGDASPGDASPGDVSPGGAPPEHHHAH